MASAASLLNRIPYRGMHLGYPGSGKTGALASLANAGFKLRILDYGDNPQSLLYNLDPKAIPNVDIVMLADKLRDNDKYLGPSGIPDAFNKGIKLMQEWKYKDEEGNEVNLGKSSDWGSDTIVVVDNLTSLGRAVKNRAMILNNKTPSTMTSAVWGAAVADVTNFIELLKADTNRFHLIVNSHKQILGPKDFTVQSGKDNAEVAELANEQIAEMAEKEMLPPRVYPVGVTKNSSTTVHGQFPTMLEFAKVTKLGKDLRVINTVSGPEMDVKIPGKVKSQYSIETGLLEIFEAMGYKAPGF